MRAELARVVSRVMAGLAVCMVVDFAILDLMLERGCARKVNGQRSSSLGVETRGKLVKARRRGRRGVRRLKGRGDKEKREKRGGGGKRRREVEQMSTRSCLSGNSGCRGKVMVTRDGTV